MTARRTAAKRDANEREIMDALIAAGATVVQLSDKGAPDLLVGLHGINYLIEVKERKGKLTPAQVALHDDWRGQIAVARTMEDALRIVGRVGIC